MPDPEIIEAGRTDEVDDSLPFFQKLGINRKPLQGFGRKMGKADATARQQSDSCFPLV